MGGTATGNPVFTIGVFVVFVCITLYVVYRASHRQSTASDYFVAGGNFTGRQNGIALGGDWLSAASFLGVTGAISVHGYDGFLYSIGFLVAWLIALFIAEPIRNTGRFTLGDVLSFRMRSRPVRAGVANATLIISLFYMIAQMAGAGGLVALLLNVHSSGGQALAVLGVGTIMIVYVLLGGMKGTTWVQIIKATLLMLCVILITLFLLGKYGFNFSLLLEEASQHNPIGKRSLAPGAQYGHSRLDFVSLALSIVLGISCLPHVLMRFYTVPNGKEARRSVTWIIGLLTIFYLATLVIGYGATALVGSETIQRAPGGENSAALLLSFEIGGSILLGLVAAIAFATILAVVAGLTLTASTSFAHDVYANVIKKGQVDSNSEVRVARITAMVVGGVSIIGGVLALNQNAAFMVSLALALAASSNLSTIVYTLFWRRFNTSGTLWSIYTGLGSCLILILFSPVFSGTPHSLIPGVDFHLLELTNPGIVSIPLSFLAGIVGTFVGKKDEEGPDKQAEMEVRSLTGIGSN